MLAVLYISFLISALYLQRLCKMPLKSYANSSVAYLDNLTYEEVRLDLPKYI